MGNPSATIETTESQQRYGDRYADGYDERRFTTTEGSFAQAFELDLFKRILQKNGAHRVLDMPIGTGRVAIPLANDFSWRQGQPRPPLVFRYLRQPYALTCAGVMKL